MNSKEMFGLFLRIVGVLGIVFIARHVLQSVPTWTVPTWTAPACTVSTCTVSVCLIIKWVIGALVSLSVTAVVIWAIIRLVQHFA